MQYPEKLRSVTVPTISLEQCRLWWKKPHLSDRFICTRDVHKKILAKCGSGDSGGPLVADGHLIGISAFSEEDINGCLLPDVYINIFQYREWINKNIYIRNTHKQQILTNLHIQHNTHIPGRSKNKL